MDNIHLYPKQGPRGSNQKTTAQVQRLGLKGLKFLETLLWELKQRRNEYLAGTSILSLKNGTALRSKSTLETGFSRVCQGHREWGVGDAVAPPPQGITTNSQQRSLTNVFLKKERKKLAGAWSMI